MKSKLAVFTVAVVISVCAGGLAQRPPNMRDAKPEEVPFVYNANDYGKVEIESVAKQVVEKDSLPEEAPAHSCYHLEDKRALPALDKGPRYFYPTYSTVCIIPLFDSSVADFAKSYPYLHEAAVKLRKLLARRPGRFKFDDINDLPFNNAAGTIQSRLEYLSFKTGAGVLFLTQYSQDTPPSPINNEELTCNFQGLTNDGRYYIAARLAITHPSLPKGIDSTDTTKLDPKLKYLKKDEQRLNSFAEDSFNPSLRSLKSLITSISTK